MAAKPFASSRQTAASLPALFGVQAGGEESSRRGRADPMIVGKVEAS